MAQIETCSATANFPLVAPGKSKYNGFMSSEKKPWKTITLTNGEKAKIDAEDYERVSQHKWRVIQKTPSSKKTVVTSIRTEKGVRQLSLGRFLMDPPKGKLVYPRRYQTGFDFRKNNLIVCTMKERQQMLPKRSHPTTSIYKGVTYDQAKKLWRASLQVDGKNVTIGLFKDEQNAARAYNKAARKQFGEMAYQNQIKKRSNRRIIPTE